MAQRSKQPQVGPAPELLVMSRATVFASATNIVPNLDASTSLVAAAISSSKQRRHSSEADPARGNDGSEYDRSDISSAVVSTADRFASLAHLLMVSHPNGLEPNTKKANHDAIIQHFQLRNVSMKDSYARHDDAAGDATDELDRDQDSSSLHHHSNPDGSLSTLFAARRTMRKAKSKRDSIGSIRHLKDLEKEAEIVVARGSICRRFIALHRRTMRACRDVKRALQTPVSPTGTVAQLRGIAILVTMLIQLFFLPFVPIYFPRGAVVITVMSVFFDIVCLVDFGFNFNAAYFDDKTSKIEFSRRKIAKRYIKTRGLGWLIVDCIAALPVDTLLLVVSQHLHHATSPVLLLAALLPRSFLRYLRWHWLLRHSIWGVRLAKVTKELSLRLALQRYSLVLQVARTVLVLVAATHYIACLWRATSGVDLTLAHQDPWGLYRSDLTTAVHLLVGVGVPNEATLDEDQSIFAIGAVLFGALVLAYVTGAVAVVVTASNVDSGRYTRNLTRALAVMDKMHLPAKLQRRIHQYYDYLWVEHDAIDGEDIARFVNGLSPSLGLEVRLFKYMDLVLGVRFWRNCSADFVTQIMQRLQVTAYLPEDYVMRQGEVGDTLFVINKGICELRAAPLRDDNVGSVKLLPAVRRMAAGTAFGELALVLNYRRTATVRALTFVEMCVLRRSAFQEILLRYRDDRREVLREILQSTIEKKGQQFVPFPWEELVATTVATQNRKQPANTWEAADLLVDLIDMPETVDDSIQFGFRDLDHVAHHRLRPAHARTADSVAHRLKNVEKWQSATSERLSMLEKHLAAVLALASASSSSSSEKTVTYTDDEAKLSSATESTVT